MGHVSETQHRKELLMNAENVVIENLQKMDWGHDLSPLVDFLNAAIVSAEMQEFAILRNEIEAILQEFCSAYTLTDGSVEFIEIQLEKKLHSAFNEVKIIDSVAGTIQVNLVVLGAIENIWVDFICIFLYRSWRAQLAQCPHCDTWFERSRRNKIYCTGNCRNKAAYARHGDVRRSERRKRYSEQKAL